MIFFFLLCMVFPLVLCVKFVVLDCVLIELSGTVAAVLICCCWGFLGEFLLFLWCIPSLLGMLAGGDDFV